MGGRKISIKELTEAQAADVLREIADRLEGVPAEASAKVQGDFENILKLKIGVKREFNGFSLKIKSKAFTPEPLQQAEGSEQSPEAAPFEADGKPKYKKLKKRMKSDFKVMKEHLLASQLPPEAVVERFLSDSELMTTYPGKGDEFYGPYNNAVAAFRRSFSSKNFEACKNAYQTLDQLMKECHDRYK